MKIKLDDAHFLESDQYNLWISVQKVSKNGKPYSRNVTGYYQDFESLMDDYIKKSFMASKATSFTTLRKDLKAIKKQVSNWGDVLNIKVGELNKMEQKETKKARDKD